MKWTAAGRQHVQRLWIEREARAAVLHDDAGGRQHAAGAEFPIKRLDVRDDETTRIRRAHPDCVAFAVRRGPARRLARIDLRRLGIEECRQKIPAEICRDFFRIRDDPIAHAERALGCFDNAMNMFEAFGPGDTKALEQRKDDQRRQILASEAENCRACPPASRR